MKIKSTSSKNKMWDRRQTMLFYESVNGIFTQVDEDSDRLLFCYIYELVQHVKSEKPMGDRVSPTGLNGIPENSADEANQGLPALKSETPVDDKKIQIFLNPEGVLISDKLTDEPKPSSLSYSSVLIYIGISLMTGFTALFSWRSGPTGPISSFHAGGSVAMSISPSAIGPQAMDRLSERGSGQSLAMGKIVARSEGFVESRDVIQNPHAHAIGLIKGTLDVPLNKAVSSKTELTAQTKFWHHPSPQSLGEQLGLENLENHMGITHSLTLIERIKLEKPLGDTTVWVGPEFNANFGFRAALRGGNPVTGVHYVVANVGVEHQSTTCAQASCSYNVRTGQVTTNFTFDIQAAVRAAYKMVGWGDQLDQPVRLPAGVIFQAAPTSFEATYELLKVHNCIEFGIRQVFFEFSDEPANAKPVFLVCRLRDATLANNVVVQTSLSHLSRVYYDQLARPETSANFSGITFNAHKDLVIFKFYPKHN